MVCVTDALVPVSTRGRVPLKFTGQLQVGCCCEHGCKVVTGKGLNVDIMCVTHSEKHCSSIKILSNKLFTEVFSTFIQATFYIASI